MRRPRIHTPGPLAEATVVELTDGRAHYVSRVLRMARGDRCLLFDGSGVDYHATILEVSRRGVRLQVTEGEAVASESPLDTHLLLALTRGSRMDVALQKSVELGVASLAPVVTERCGVRLDPRQAERRMSHWQGVVIGAAEQCGRSRLPTLLAPQGLGDGLDGLVPGPATRLVLEPEASARLADLAPPAAGLTVLVGPEGGLSPRESSLAAERGFQGVRLGPRVLRAETAPLAILAAVQTLWGDLG